MHHPRIFLARHGVTQANVDRVHAGLSDVPLLEQGREQAHALAERVLSLPIGEMWTSPLRRARETAEIVATRCRLPPFVDDDLRELEAGPWEGLSDAQIRQRFPEQFERWQADPAAFRLTGRETLESVRRRMVAAVDRIRARGSGSLLLSHSEPLRVLRVHYTGDPLNCFAEYMPEHAQLLELVQNDGRTLLRPA
jgi:broad specificity phosphatase PhoE